MGWTTTSEYQRHYRGVFTIKEYLDHEFACDNPLYPRHEVLGSSLHGNSEYYAAIRSTDRKTGESVIFALIALVSYKPSDPDGHTLGWKDISENSGPFCYKCPERILKLLDPTENENALEWRRTCREKRAAAKAFRAALRDGAVVEFASPLRFSSGVMRQRFTVEKQGRALRFRAEDGTLCRIPKAAAMALTVITAAA